MNEIILRAKDLAVGYDGVTLIPDISFSVKQGEILTLIGPNGAGKSTLLKTLIKQLDLLAGTVYLGEQDMQTMKAHDIAQKMSLLMTTRIGSELMTVQDIVETGRFPYTGRLGILSDHDHEVVANSMDLVHVTEIKDRDFNKISDGQRQRVMLARAICQEPELLVMDEPTSFLDIHHKMELLSILKRLVREQNIGVILSLHELDLAQKVSDHLLCIKDGKVDRYGTPEEVFSMGSDADHYIRDLYDIQNGTFVEEFGSLELEAPKGNPKTFVIGGGGTGIPLYRMLQRRDIPFVAGVLSENDVEYPVAKALASEVVTVPSFEPVGETKVTAALELLQNCETVYCTLSSFGTMNKENQRLLEEAKSRNLLVDSSAVVGYNENDLNLGPEKGLREE